MYIYSMFFFKCSSAQFYNILTSLSKVHTEIISMKDLASKELKSSLLNGILGKVITISTVFRQDNFVPFMIFATRYIEPFLIVPFATL